MPLSTTPTAPTQHGGTDLDLSGFARRWVRVHAKFAIPVAYWSESIEYVNMTLTGACRIYVVRHGTTTLNVENRYRGRLDVDLDEQGWRDAHTAAAQLADKGISAVYSSPLRRARDTARTIADASGIAEVVDSGGLINLDYGRWDALTPAEASDLDPIAYARYRAFEPGATCPDGENLDAAAARVVEALRLIGERHPGESVVAVSHAAMVRLALVNVTGGPRADWRRKLPNGSITVVDVDGPKLRLPELLDEPAG